MNVKTLIDYDVRWSQRLRLPTKGNSLFNVAAFFAHSGDSWFWMAGLGMVWLFANPYWRDHTMLMMLGIVVLAILVLAIKFTVRRRRPDGDWGAVYRSTDPHSFPSGHACRAVMLAVVALGLGPVWLAWLLVVWAPLVCLARVVTGLHYLSDVAAGILIGLLAGVIVLAVHPLAAAWFPFLFR
jgi:membrane-associated phospholipid phosphatase